MINIADTEQRFIDTPSGRGWLMGFDGEKTVTVHFTPEEGSNVGPNKCFDVSECEEVEE